MLRGRGQVFAPAAHRGVVKSLFGLNQILVEREAGVSVQVAARQLQRERQMTESFCQSRQIVIFIFAFIERLFEKGKAFLFRE